MRAGGYLADVGRQMRATCSGARRVAAALGNGALCDAALVCVGKVAGGRSLTRCLKLSQIKVPGYSSSSSGSGMNCTPS